MSASKPEGGPAAPVRSVLDEWREQVAAIPSTARGRRSRARLMIAAKEVFAREGFQGARVVDIAERAGVAHGTFYTYFESKEAILRALILELHGALLGREAQALAETDEHEDPARSIERANRTYLEAFELNRGLSIVWENVAAVDPEVALVLGEAKLPFVRRTERAIRRLQEAGRVDHRIDPVYAAHALTAMVSRFAFAWFAHGHSFHMDEAVQQLTLLWTNALGLDNHEVGARGRHGIDSDVNFI